MISDKDKITLIHVILRTEMYVGSSDEKAIIGFITGFELGRNAKCDFTSLVKDYLQQNLKIKSSSDGWPGQIRRYANKKDLLWAVAFKQISLEVLAAKESGGLTNTMSNLIKSRIIFLIEKVEADGHPWFNEEWIQTYITFCTSKSPWFADLWDQQASKYLRTINNLIKSGRCFESTKPYLPTKTFLKQTERFLKKANNS